MSDTTKPTQEVSGQPTPGGSVAAPEAEVIDLPDHLKDVPLTLVKQETFAQLMSSPGTDWFGNGTKAYSEAYGVPMTDPVQISKCAGGASRLLRNAKVSARMHVLIKKYLVLTDDMVDVELAYTIVQKKDLSAKNAGIKEYNRLTGRGYVKKDDPAAGGVTNNTMIVVSDQSPEDIKEGFMQYMTKTSKVADGKAKK